MGRPNPVSIEVVRVPSSASVDSEIEKLVDKIIDAEKARDEWGQNQRKFTRQRYAIRNKTRTTPWKGASNLNIPMIDKAIRRWKPGIVRLTHESTPVAHFHPTEETDITTAQTAETFYDWLFKIHMDSLDEVVYLADIVGHRGSAYLEVSWDYRTERRVRILRPAQLFPQGLPVLMDPTTGQPLDPEKPEPDLRRIGAEILRQYSLTPDRPDHVAAVARAVGLIEQGEEAVKLVFRDTVCDKPKIVALDPIQVILPARDTNSADAPFLCIRNIVSSDDLRKMVRDQILEPGPTTDVINTIEDRVRQAQSTGGIDKGVGLTTPGQIVREDRDAMDELIGILQNHEDTETIEIWKIYCWIDINGDSEDERAIIWYHPGTKTTLAKMEYTLPFPRWNVVEFTFEKTHSKRALSSRGIPQLLSPLQIEVNRLHNNRLDAEAIQLAPVFAVKSSGNFVRNLRWGPGVAWPVQDPANDVKPIVQDLRNLSLSLQEEQFTRLIAEEYVGIFDAALGQAGGADRRTATEIEAVQAQVSGVFSLDAALWQKSWRDAHRMIFALWRELGEEETFIRVVGQQAESFQKILKSEIDKDYDIQPAGTPTNTNKAIELNRAREVMQLLWNPFTLQTGALKPLQLLNWYLASHDPKRARQLLAQNEQELADQQTILQAVQEIGQARAEGSEIFGGANQVRGQQAGTAAR